MRTQNCPKIVYRTCMRCRRRRWVHVNICVKHFCCFPAANWMQKQKNVSNRPRVEIQALCLTRIQTLLNHEQLPYVTAENSLQIPKTVCSACLYWVSTETHTTNLVCFVRKMLLHINKLHRAWMLGKNKHVVLYEFRLISFVLWLCESECAFVSC